MNPETPASPEHVATFRKDYRPPDFWVREVELDVTLDPAATRVRGVLSVERNGTHDRPLRLAGDGLEPIAVRIDGVEARWSMDGEMLVVDVAGATAKVETEVVIAPDANSKLMGLYSSGGILCTQCESEGFRRITFHPDRPDILSTYRVRMSADKARFPVLLANGNLVASGDGEDGQHWAEWEDPFPKPSYLFAMVAGDLAANRASFTTSSGRTVDLAIWVREADLAKTAHAMASLKQAMAWDEATYGREYDLDLFNIVAVDDFNFGAMENKGLNIFNSRYVLADQDTATDADFDAIAGVVAHEYFHNWSGNRVTCRDWFQLSLKEGFTVFRDQSFSADIGSAAVKRIDDVRLLRAVQFPEDSGPLAHPVRPNSYLEIANFYTATIYNKGAEVIRMMHTILGAKAFRAGADLYFARHDGEAATCDDFVAAMEDASGVDLARFKIWYEQAGTPKVEAKLVHDAEARTATLHLSQSVAPTPGQPDKSLMPIPLRTALIGATSGQEIVPERVIMLEQAAQAVVFENVEEAPLLSINRGFSAPVMIAAERSPGELEALAASDSDPFARYEALQELMMGVLIAGVSGKSADPAPVIEAVRNTLMSNDLDAAFKAEAILLPSESFIADQATIVDPDAIHAVRKKLQIEILTGVRRSVWRKIRESHSDARYVHDSEANGRRRLKNVALGYLMAEHTEYSICDSWNQYRQSDNMTDRQAALSLLASSKFGARTDALEDFHQRYANDPLVLDKWFAIQASAQQRETIDVVERLLRHPDFTMKNPNRLRALAGSFAGNQWVFHEKSGRGYRLLGALIVKADAINPQVAARLVPPLGRWRRFEPGRAALMRAELERIVATPGLSKDVFEQASKSLA